MDEFAVIDRFFKPLISSRGDVIVGIGDDAACLSVPSEDEVLVSTDTLVAGVHFLKEWDAYDVASRAIRVTISDIAAMGGTPTWITLGLTLPELDSQWLERFSKGLKDTLAIWDLALVGGNITKGPLSMTLTVQGLVPKGKSVLRRNAKAGDKIYVTGELGAAAFALRTLDQSSQVRLEDKASLMKKLLHPMPRIDLNTCLRHYATAAIDISDSLSADLNHICIASGLGACIEKKKIPIDPIIKTYVQARALDFALYGGDDYELCFTVAPNQEKGLLTFLAKQGLVCYLIGVMQKEKELTLQQEEGLVHIIPRGYNHFKN